MIEDHEIKSADDAKRVIAEIKAEQQRLSDLNRDRSEGQEAKIADLKAAVRALSEAQNRAMETGPGSAIVRDFVHKDADGTQKIRWSSGVDRETGDYLPGLLDTPSEDAWVQKAQRLFEQRCFVRAMTRSATSHRGGPGASPRTDRAIARHLERAPAPLQRLFSDASTTGAEFIPDLLSPDLVRDLTMARRLEANFPVWTMSGKELRIPFLTTALRPYKKGAITGDDPANFTSSTIVSAQRSITASGLAVRAQLDEDTTEDSVVEGLTLHRNLLIEALTDGTEDCIVNGDTAASHQDAIASWDIRSRWGSSGLGGSSDHRTAWLGLRAYAYDNSSTVDGSSAETLAGVLSARASLDSPHGVDGSLMIVTSPEFYLAKILGFDEVQTVDKYGAGAVVLTGEVSRLAGMPIVISEFIDSEFNTAGLWDNSTKTKTGYLIVNRNRWYVGARRSAVVEVQKDIRSGVIDAVSTVRKTFFSVDSTKKNVIWSFNNSIS